MPADPQFLRSRSCFQSPRFSLAEETYAVAEAEITRPVVHHPGAVAVLAQPSPEQVVLVRQYRYPLRRWTLEIPAGTREAGENPLHTAQRELSEEAGLAAARWQEMGRFFPAVGVSDEEMILYHAEDLQPQPGQPDEGELVEVAVVSLADCAALRAEGVLCDAKTLLALGCLCGGQWWLDSAYRGGLRQPC